MVSLSDAYHDYMFAEELDNINHYNFYIIIIYYNYNHKVFSIIIVLIVKITDQSIMNIVILYKLYKTRDYIQCDLLTDLTTRPLLFAQLAIPNHEGSFALNYCMKYSFFYTQIGTLAFLLIISHAMASTTPSSILEYKMERRNVKALDVGGADIKVCSLCVQFAGQFINELLNIVLS